MQIQDGRRSYVSLDSSNKLALDDRSWLGYFVQGYEINVDMLVSCMKLPGM